MTGGNGGSNLQTLNDEHQMQLLTRQAAAGLATSLHSSDLYEAAPHVASASEDSFRASSGQGPQGTFGNQQLDTSGATRTGSAMVIMTEQ